MALSKTGIGQPQSDRTRQHLALLKTQARTKIAATETTPAMAVSPRLRAARLYRDGAHTRHAEMLKTYREAQERLAAHLEPRRSFADRLLGRHPAGNSIEALERDVAAARNDLIAAEKAVAGADGNLLRMEKAEAAECTQRLEQIEAQRRTAMEMLGEVVMAQRMARAFPALIYCGPAFVVWSGGKIERKRRKGLRDPGATNIWGIPLDFG